MRFIIALILTISAASGYTLSGTTYTTSGSASDVQLACSAAPSGSTIKVPAGTFSWGSHGSTGVVTISGRGITLQGAGSGSTIVQGDGPQNAYAGVLDVSQISGVSTRITGIQFQGGHMLGIHGNTTSAPFRVDNCIFDGSSSAYVNVMLSMDGMSPGLIDHCSFIGGAAGEFIHNNAAGSGNNAGWLDDITPGGGTQFVYIENCTFTCNQSNVFASGIESYYGARTCLRHSTFNYCQIDEHGNSGTIGNVGSRWYEFYENTFVVPANYNQSNYFALRDGSGVVFNNYITGGPNAAGSGGIIQLTQDFTGSTSSPIMYQVGRGLGQNRSPVYLWGFGAYTANIFSGSDYVKAGTDFIVSTSQPSNMMICQRASDGSGSTYNYTPFTYPYPLAANGMPSPGQASSTPTPVPQAPANLRVAQPTR
jgi:hypothetical protein